MSYSKLIHEYLDVGLDEPTQEALFMEIARDPELRHEFNSQLKINNVASQDLATIKTPELVTSEVFKNLGFKTPSMSRPLLSKSLLMLLIGLISGGLVTLATVGFLNNGFETESIDVAGSDNTSQLNTSKIPVSSSMAVSELEERNNNNNIGQDQIVLSSRSNDKNDGSNGTSSKNIQQKDDLFLNSETINRSQNNPTQNIQEDNSLENSDFSGQYFTITSSENYSVSPQFETVIVNAIDTRTITNTRMSSFIISSENSNLFDLEEDQSIYHIGIKQLNYSNQSNLSEVNSINNIALSFVYRFYHGLAFVVEAGREDFFQQYEQNISGTTIVTSQEPTMYWMGAGFRYSQNGIFDQNIVSPFLQVIAAGTSQGPLIRPQIGLNMRVSNLFSITSSYERPLLFYSLNGENYSTSKNMFSIGFNLNL